MPIVFTDINSSSAIERIGYDVITTELRIVFKDKEDYPEYSWGGVQKPLIEAFFQAPSKGKFYWRYLKDKPEYYINRALGSYKLAALGRGVRHRASGAAKRIGKVLAFKLF